MKFVSRALAIALVVGGTPAIAQTGECEDARDCLNAGLEIVFSNDPNLDVAALYFRRATEYDDNLALAWYNLGVLYDMMREYDRAIEVYQKAIDLSIQGTGEWGTVEPLSALHNRGVAEARLGRYEDAIATFERVLDIDPNHENAHNNLEWVRSQLERE